VKRKVALFVTCLVDQLRPEIGHAAVRVLERAGCAVDFDPRQTCCGQPAFNAGFRGAAQDVVRHLVDVLDGPGDVVVPSGSCTAMIHRLHELFPDDEGMRARCERVAARTHELSAFLVRELGVTDLGARFDGKVAWHHACHGLRELGLAAEPRALLRAVHGLELVEPPLSDACCGFGGTFSASYPELSTAMLDPKLDRLEEARVDAVSALDGSCLEQMRTRLVRRGSRIRAVHLAEILAS
jgi:L-lactate dehydrogenase complex protein LldE